MLYDGSLVIALIPARGGSKGIPRKNLVALAGKPLIVHTINAAQRAALVDATWVSSEDAEILAVASALGAQTLVRPNDLADDCASPVDVVHHFLASQSGRGHKQDAVIVYLQPTSPLRNETHIDRALQAMVAAGVDGAVSVVEADKPPHKAFRLDDSGNLVSLFTERLSNARRQDLPRCYYPNGAIYAFRISAFLSRQGFPSNGSFPFIMSALDSVDIDDADDLARAEAIIGAKIGRI